MNDTITIPGFEPISTQSLSELLSGILSAVEAVNDADRLFQAIANTRECDKSISNRNAIMLHQTMEIASGGLDMACRDLAERCRPLSSLLRRK